MNQGRARASDGGRGTRERLLDTASDLFAERGFDGVSVRDITRQARANLGAVTYYFGSKDALFSEVVARELKPMLEMGRDIAASDAPPEERLRALLEQYATYIMHERPRLKVFFSECMAGGQRLPQDAVSGLAFRNRLFADVVAEGVRRGELRSVDTECAAWLFFGMLSAYILFNPLIPHRSRDGRYGLRDVRRVVETAMDLFLNGLRTAARRSR